MNGRKRITLEKTARASDFILEITADPRGCTQGTIQHCQSGQSQDFRSFIELIVLMESKLNELQFPQSTHELRSW